jgi:hypothetical protein
MGDGIQSQVCSSFLVSRLLMVQNVLYFFELKLWGRNDRSQSIIFISSYLET